MKKIISVLLAALMLMSCFGMVSFAEDETVARGCNCAGYHKSEPANSCNCCVYCDNLDPSYRLACYSPAEDKFCCDKCTGIYPCNCGCGCGFCKTKNDDINDKNGTLGDIITEQDKSNFVDAFQAALKKVSDFFDKLFDTIFEFLKIDEVLGRGDRN